MISTIIVNYGTGHLLEDLCSRINREPYVQEIIVVDNMGDVPLELINRLSIKLIQNSINVGFAKAVNIGVKTATQPWLLLINPDVIPLPNSITQLFNSAKDFDAALAGPRFFWDDQKIFRLPPATGYSLCHNLIQSSNLLDSSPWEQEQLSFEWAIRHDRFWGAQKPFWEPFLSGACLLINKKHFPPDIFDDRFFLYYEDVDLCIYARNKELLTLCIPESEMIHYWSQSPNPQTPKHQLMVESEKLFMEKHYSNLISLNVSTTPSKKPTLPKIMVLQPKTAIPTFSIPETNRLSAYFEIATSPLFIPFAQTAVLSNSTFSLPINIWNKLPKGTYFSRVRTEAGYTIGQIWQWSKP